MMDTINSTALLGTSKQDFVTEEYWPNLYVAFKRPPRVSPTLRAISSVAKLSNAAKGMMAMKLTTKTATGEALTKWTAMPIGAAISRILIQELKIVALSWLPSVNGLCFNDFFDFDDFDEMPIFDLVSSLFSVL